MIQIRRECPNRTLHDSYLLDLPRPNRRGFPAMLRCRTQSPRGRENVVSAANRAEHSDCSPAARSVPPKQSCMSTASRAKCSPSSFAPGLQLYRARPARRLWPAVSGSLMPAGGGWKTRPNQSYESEPLQGFLARVGLVSAAARKRTGSRSPSLAAPIIRPAMASRAALGWQAMAAS